MLIWKKNNDKRRERPRNILSGVAHPSPSPSSSFHFVHLSCCSLSCRCKKFSHWWSSSTWWKEGSTGGTIRGVRLKKKIKHSLLRQSSVRRREFLIFWWIPPLILYYLIFLIHFSFQPNKGKFDPFPRISFLSVSLSKIHPTIQSPSNINIDDIFCYMTFYLSDGFDDLLFARIFSALNFEFLDI